MTMTVNSNKVTVKRREGGHESITRVTIVDPGPF